MLKKINIIMIFSLFLFFSKQQSLSATKIDVRSCSCAPTPSLSNVSVTSFIKTLQNWIYSTTTPIQLSRTISCTKLSAAQGICNAILALSLKYTTNPELTINKNSIKITLSNATKSGISNDELLFAQELESQLIIKQNFDEKGNCRSCCKSCKKGLDCESKKETKEIKIKEIQKYPKKKQTYSKDNSESSNNSNSISALLCTLTGWKLVTVGKEQLNKWITTQSFKSSLEEVYKIYNHLQSMDSSLQIFISGKNVQFLISNNSNGTIKIQDINNAKAIDHILN